MKFHRRLAVHFGSVVLMLFVNFGCQGEPEQLPEVTVNVPDQFERDGIAWQKQTEVQYSDNRRLAEFFARNQGLAGSPEFEGNPTVFAAGRNDRRFYWLRPSVDGMRWQCIEFRNRQFTVTDGAESPF